MNLRADDYVQILNLYSRYNLTSDGGDPEGYADCFLPDGELVAGDLHVHGRGELVQYKTTEAASRNGRKRRHINGSIFLAAIEDGVVRGACYLQAFDGDADGALIPAQTGSYSDTIVRGPHGWKFQRRDLSLD